MTSTPDLNHLLSALRAAGFAIGIRELVRLKQVFALAPAATHDSSVKLKSLLQAIVVKQAEDAAHFERIYTTWLDQQTPAIQVTEPAAIRLPFPSQRRSKKRHLSLITIVCFILLSALPSYQIEPADIDIPVISTDPGTPDSPETPNCKPEVFSDTLSNSDQQQWQGWQDLALGLFALLATVALWFSLKRRRWLPEPEPLPSHKGPPRILLHGQPSGLVLLDTHQQETLVWGVDHFISETPTRRLDIPTTVRATAQAAGMPRIHFQAARYQREIWLWLDEAATDSNLARLADEIERVLLNHGLCVERARFWGIPDRLTDSRHHAFAPNEIEERQATAMVVVLSDGRLLTQQAQADDRRVRIDALLRNLSHWPRLWFVDPDEGGNGLKALLTRHHIDCIHPAQLASRISGASASSPPRPARSNNPSLWAAACALAPAPVAAELAFALHAHLGLADSSWQLNHMFGQAATSVGRLSWPTETRVQLINWLRNAEVNPASNRSHHSVLNRALNFWTQAYEDEAQRQSEANPHWQDTPAEQHLRMEQSLLQLWQENPGAAILQLYGLYQGHLSVVIQQQLALFNSQDKSRDDQIALPWRWHTRSSAEQQMLLTMGFAGGAIGAINLRRSGRLWLGVSIGLGLAIGALTMAVSRPWPQHQPALSMAFVNLCSGNFLMGSPSDEVGRDDDESPQHTVTLSAFAIGQYEVTHAQYRQFKREHDTDDDRPVTYVNWRQANGFCQHYGYRLPTEAEWEYAARAGTQSRWSFGDDESQLEQYAWYSENAKDETHPVGTRKPNPWGLYDMYGNAWEWVVDWYAPYPNEAQNNPTGSDTGKYRVLRGGAFFDEARLLRSANRDGNRPEDQGRGIGFRCARGPRRQL